MARASDLQNGQVTQSPVESVRLARAVWQAIAVWSGSPASLARQPRSLPDGRARPPASPDSRTSTPPQQPRWDRAR